MSAAQHQHHYMFQLQLQLHHHHHHHHHHQPWTPSSYFTRPFPLMQVRDIIFSTAHAASMVDTSTSHPFPIVHKYIRPGHAYRSKHVLYSIPSLPLPCLSKHMGELVSSHGRDGMVVLCVTPGPIGLSMG